MNLGSKKLGEQTKGEQKKPLGQKNLVQTNLRSAKYFWVHKNFWIQKFVSKIFWRKISLDPTKIWIKSLRF